MAKSSADDAELRHACAAAVAASGARGEEVTFSIRVAKGRGIFEKLGRLSKPRVLALTGQRHSSFPAYVSPRAALLGGFGPISLRLGTLGESCYQLKLSWCRCCLNSVCTALAQIWGCEDRDLGSLDQAKS
jgi:hypothetical protein